MSRPLLFLDVDGPLNPYAAQPERRPEGYTTIRVPLRSRRPLRVWLNPAHGRELSSLGYELCWATTWMAEANRWIAPVLGLPQLPYVDFGTGLFAHRPDGVHWKTEAIVAYAGGRPFAWVDDEQSPADAVFVADRHPAPALLHHVNPRVGLREGDFAALARFAAGLPATG
ncbi:HAD domain-containing protein [Streptomyces sp. MB22_4]|uniref:HAD domain-containing protein n=1 Tax=Streptomyces sp. MB22_4 TaxID=3383120 RepID=UPI0039A0C74B